MIQFFKENPIGFLNIMNNSIFVTIGILAIYFHLYNFGPISVAYICTFRKIITILLSIYIYNHNMGFYHSVGLTIIFIVIVVDFLRNLNKKKKAMLDIQAKKKKEI